MIRLSNWRRYGDTFQMSNLLDRRRFEKIALRRFFDYSRFITGIFNIFLNKQWPRFLRSSCWCPKWDLNPYGFLHSILSRTRIPIPPFGLRDIILPKQWLFLKNYRIYFDKLEAPTGIEPVYTVLQTAA